MSVFRVRIEGQIHHLFLGTGTAIGPRRRDEAIVRVVSTEHGKMAAQCAARGSGLSRGLIHYQRKDEIIGRAFSKRREGVLGPDFQGGRQIAVRL